MTVNVDLKKYSKLLTSVLPMPIKNDEELARTLVEFEKLLDKSLAKGLSLEEDRMFDLLADLIEKYEDAHYRIETDDITPLEMLKFRPNLSVTFSFSFICYKIIFYMKICFSLCHVKQD